ncbi:MAG: hypothetical protein IH623_10720 [Verrucomicrobia bacterium]|nr:hypothetical protein [Verrucomicrobiota bacterium]
MRATFHHRTDARPVQSRVCAGPVRARRSPRLAAFRRWAGDFSCRAATNRCVFYGLLLLAASLFVGAIIREYEELWRAAASLGIAAIVIGLVHAWLDARADRQHRHTRSKGKGNESSINLQNHRRPGHR